MEDEVAVGDGGEEGGEVGDVAVEELEVLVVGGGEERDVAGGADKGADVVAVCK